MCVFLHNILPLTWPSKGFETYHIIYVDVFIKDSDSTFQTSFLQALLKHQHSSMYAFSFYIV